MKIQRLQIDQQMAQIRVDSQMAALSIDMPKRTMEIEQRHAQMSIEKAAPKIELDMQSFRNSIGLKDALTLMEETAAAAKEIASQNIKQTAAEGDIIGTLPSNVNIIAQVAKNNMLEVKAPVMNSGKVPSGPVKMEGKPGKLDINWSRHDLKINWNNFQTPTITVEPKASVDVQVVTEPYIEYTVIEEEIPPDIGMEIDEEI